MASPQKRIFTLPADQANYIDTLVASGAYPSGAEVIRAGLEALQDRDAATEQWLRDEVVPICEAMAANPERAIPMEEVFAELQAHHAAQIAQERREP